jgi:restriction system protein
MVRAGRHGEREQEAIEKGFVAIGWDELPDLSHVKTRIELTTLFKQYRPTAKKMTVANEVGQLWRFIDSIKIGDLVVLPLKHRSAIAVGRIEGNYEYAPIAGDGLHHFRKVKWIKTDIPRSEFDQDLLYSFGAFMTVCQIERNNAEERVNAVLKGTQTTIEDSEIQESELDIEQAAKDQILKFIDIKFKGHELARLVEAVIQAQGYITSRSMPGPDGGVDILAGSGQMGFNEPKICVQVKSSSSPVDVTVLRNLIGTMHKFKADQGLLVSWGGFNNKVIEEARLSFFCVRLWDSGDLLSEILTHFEHLPDSLKAELPLKRMWALVQEDEE